MSYSFSVSGVKEFQKLLNTEDKINKVKDVVRVNTAQLARNASKFVPVDTGFSSPFIEERLYLLLLKVSR